MNFDRRPDHLLCDPVGFVLVDHVNFAREPETPPWADPSRRPPFANPAEFVVPGRFGVVSVPDEISFNWSYREDNAPVAVEIWIRGEIHGRIAPGSKPSYCRLAAKDGPLALKFV